MKLNQNFQRGWGGGDFEKFPSMGEVQYGYFLELRIDQ